MLNFLTWYRAMVQKRPILTQTVTAVSIMGLGDLICQYITSTSKEGEFSLDYIRAIKQASFAIFYTPFQHWQLNIVTPKLFPGKDIFSVLKSVVYSQTTSAAIFNYTFFTYMDLLSGKSKDERKEELKKKFLPTLLNNWKFWPFVMFYIFGFVPVHYRIIFVSFTGLIWNTYLSFVQNRVLDVKKTQIEIKQELNFAL